MEHPILQTERLILRPFELSDLDFVFRHFGSAEVTKFLYDNEPPTSLEEAKKILNWCMDHGSKNHVRWCICLAESGEQIGSCGFHLYNPKNNSSEIGYDISPAHWRKGYTSEALASIFDHGFGAMGLNRIQAFVSTENAASTALMERMGFSLEGVVRDMFLFRGAYHDHNQYSLLRKDLSENE